MNPPILLTDIDECFENSHNYKQDTKCVNEEGSFHCDCYPGYIKDGDNCKGNININININFNNNMYSLSFKAFLDKNYLFISLCRVFRGWMP